MTEPQRLAKIRGDKSREERYAMSQSNPSTLREAIEEILRPDRTDYFVTKTTDLILEKVNQYFLSLIGEDEPILIGELPASELNARGYRNQLRSELRDKVKHE